MNQWYHVCGVYNASAKTLDIYVNGVLDNGTLIGTVPSAQVLPAGNPNIGRRIQGYYFLGVIDEARIYSRALSPTDIQKDMATAISTYTAAPAGTPLSMSAPLTAANVSSKPIASSGDTVSAPALARSTVSRLSCAPRVVNAGGVSTCELRVTASPASAELHVSSSSSLVKTPAVVTSRPNQTSLTFQVSIDPTAKQHTAVINATSGDVQVQDTVAVVPAQAPVMSVASTHLARLGEPLRFVVGAADPSGLPLQLSAEGLPGGATFDGATGQFDWVPNVSQAGEYHLTFSAVNSIGQSSTARVSVEAGTGVPVLDESQQLACSPNAVASLSGKWLAASLGSVSEPSGSAAELGGTKVRINQQLVPVLFSSTRKVQFLCPASLPGTPLSVVVETPGGTTSNLAGSMREATPRILSLRDTEGEQGVVSFADSADLAMPRNAQVTAHPAQPGDTIQIWTTGLGLNAESQLATLSATVGGVDVPVQSVEAVPGAAGLYTVQLRAPMVFGDAVPVRIEVITPGGSLVQGNTVSIAIEAGSN